ncbi:MAG: DUF4157 domain-containing protein [Acidobacteria bacterium]|nr:DUF4157 domain-containing protein [Acidobacteriota bacterium]
MAVLAGRKPANKPAAQRAGSAAPQRRPAKPSPKPLLQAKLTINNPNDRFEQEADSIADRVMSMPEKPSRFTGAGPGEEEAGRPRMQRQPEEEEQAQTKALQREEEPDEETAQTSSLQRREEEEKAQTSSLQRQEDGEEEAQTSSLQREEEEEAQTSSLQRQMEQAEEEEPAVAQREEDEAQRQEEGEEVQAKGRPRGAPRVTRSFETRLNALRAGGGRPLDAPLRRFMESRFGLDLGHVRVHSGPGPAALAQQAHARAFTVGRHLVFNSGEYRPNADQGRRLIAHELTHVLQQRGGLHSVQREVFPPETAEARRSEDRLLEEIVHVLGLDDATLPRAIHSITTELLRHALHGPEAALLEALTAQGATGAAVSRVLEASDYTLSIQVGRTARNAQATWTLARAGEKRPIFGHTATTAADAAPPEAGEDQARLRVAEPSPPRYAADPLISGPAPGPAPAPANDRIPSSPPLPQTVEPSPPQSEKLAEANAVAPVEPSGPTPEGRGDQAGADAPQQARPPIDVQAEDDVPEEKEPEKDLEAQRKAAPGAPAQARPSAQRLVSAASSAPGAPLPAAVRGSMESRFGADFSAVRVHHDRNAAQAAQAIGAEAFTVGPHVVFGEGRYQPEQPNGQTLLAHELTHVLQQREGRSPSGLLQRHGGEDCPPPDPVPEVEVVSSPAGPGEDPAFSAMENRTENRAENQATHGTGDDKSASANAAAEVKEGEKKGHAQQDQVGDMAAKADSPPAFDKQGFIDSVLQEVEKIAPETLDDVMKFSDRGKAGAVKSAVQGEVASSSETTTGPLEESATADPGAGESPRTAAALDVEPPGPQPGSIRADRAMPPPKTASEMDLRADTVRADNILKEACVTRDFMEKHNDPELKEGLSAQDDLHATTEQAPATFREGEAAELQNARAGASSEGAKGVADMFGTRSGQFGAVGSSQTQTKTDNEVKREAAAAEINTIFTDTQTKVQDRLKKLDADVSETFDRETQAAIDKFESFVRANAEKYQKSWFDSAVDFFADILFDVPPPEVRDFYREGRVTFLNDMEGVIGNVADLVETGLQDARDLVTEGKTKVQEKLDTLGGDLEDFKQQMAEQMSDKFRQLEGDINAKQGEIVKNLAQRYVKAFEKVKAIENQVRDEYKNAFERAQDALNAVVDAVAGWIAKLAAMVGDTANKIIKDPGAFLSNLAAGIIQGLEMFIGDIANNIKAAVVEWITGNLGGAGIQLPATFDLKGIVGFLLDLVGLGISGIKEIARQVFGNTVVSLIEKGVEGFEKIKEIFDILVNEGPAGLFRYLQAEFAKMKEQVMGEAGKALAEGLVVAGIKKVLGIISGLATGGAGTVVTIVVTIIDLILWFVTNASQIAELVGTITSMANAVVMGQVGVLANAVNGVLKRILPLVLSFVGALVGIGGVVKKIQKIFKAIGKPARDAIRKLFLKFKGLVKKLLGKLGLGKGKKKKKKGKQLLTSKEVVAKVLAKMKKPTKAKTPAAAIAEKKAQAQSLLSEFQPKLEKGKLKIVILDKGAGDVEKDSDVDFTVSASPATPGSAPVPLVPDDENAVQQRFAKARTLKKFTGDSGFTVADWGQTFNKLSASTHSKDLSFGVSSGLVEKKGGKYHFKSDVPRAEIVEKGALEVQNSGRSHPAFEKGRFGIPLIQSFLSGRKVAGVPPDSFGDRAIIADVAARAQGAGAIEKVGATNTWALPKIPAKRTLPSGWGGTSDIRPKLYERGAGFPTLADTLADTVITGQIKPLISTQIQNYDDAKKAGTATDLSPWQTMISKQFAKSSEKFSIKTARNNGYYERGRYDVDHVTPLAQHWNNAGHNDGPSERIAATQGKRGGLELLERGLNRSKGSEGVRYQLWVGSGFTNTSGDKFHIESGVPFKEWE